MIVVIADDLTGAAEIGGIALRHGLSAEVQTDFDVDTDVDLIAVDTNTRLSPAKAAVRRVANVAALCREHGVDRIYKKVDSLLRGPINAELVALLEVLGVSKCLLVPSNPGLGRTISNRRYYIGGIPLHETELARNPERPVLTSEVSTILGTAEPWQVQVLQLVEELSVHQGILIGEAMSAADLTAWASVLDDSILPAGASEFFAAYLQVQGFSTVEKKSYEPITGKSRNSLFICGSASTNSRLFCKRCEMQAIPVLRIPIELCANNLQSARLIRLWAEKAVRAFDSNSQVVMAIDQPIYRDPTTPEMLSNYLGMAVEKVLKSHPVDCLFVEGGSTASTLVKRMGWKRFRLHREWATGVVSLQVNDLGLLLFMKPGSYTWPDELLKF